MTNKINPGRQYNIALLNGSTSLGVCKGVIRKGGLRYRFDINGTEQTITSDRVLGTAKRPTLYIDEKPAPVLPQFPKGEPGIGKSYKQPKPIVGAEDPRVKQMREDLKAAKAGIERCEKLIKSFLNN